MKVTQDRFCLHRADYFNKGHSKKVHQDIDDISNTLPPPKEVMAQNPHPERHYDFDHLHFHSISESSGSSNDSINGIQKEFTYRIPNLKLLTEKFLANTATQAVRIFFTPHTTLCQFLASSGLSIAKIGVQQSVIRTVNLLHSDEILCNQIPPYQYSVIPNLNIRDRSIIGAMIQNASVTAIAITITNQLVGGVPVGLFACAAGDALDGAIGTSLAWRSGLACDDLLAHNIENRNQILLRTIIVNNLSSALSCMASGALQGFVLGGLHGIIPGGAAGLMGLTIDNSIEIPRTLISHYIEWLRGQAQKEQEESSPHPDVALYFFDQIENYGPISEDSNETPTSDTKNGYILPEMQGEASEADAELEEAAFMAKQLSMGKSGFIRV